MTVVIRILSNHKFNSACHVLPLIAIGSLEVPGGLFEIPEDHLGVPESHLEVPEGLAVIPEDHLKILGFGTSQNEPQEARFKQTSQNLSTFRPRLGN